MLSGKAILTVLQSLCPDGHAFLPAPGARAGFCLMIGKPNLIKTGIPVAMLMQSEPFIGMRGKL